MTRIRIDWLSIAMAFANRPKNLTAQQFFQTELPKYTGSRRISRSTFYRKLSEVRQQLHTDENESQVEVKTITQADLQNLQILEPQTTQRLSAAAEVVTLELAPGVNLRLCVDNAELFAIRLIRGLQL